MPTGAEHDKIGKSVREVLCSRNPITWKWSDPMNIGTVTINSKIALAPMAGVSDQAFRIICRELGCGYTVTEMISAKALCYQDKKTRRIMALAPGEHPAAIQLFGSDVVCMEEAAAKIMELERHQHGLSCA